MSAQEIAQEVAARLKDLGPVSIRRYFGGAALTIDGAQFAFVMKGSLYLRVAGGDQARFEAMGAAPFSYAGASGPVTVRSYYEAPGAVFEDDDQLLAWSARSYRAALSTHPVRRNSKHRQV